MPVHVGGLLGEGGQRVRWPPLSNYWGGLAPPGPTSSYAYVLVALTVLATAIVNAVVLVMVTVHETGHVTVIAIVLVTVTKLVILLVTVTMP